MSGPLVITLKDKLEFIESLLIPSFTPKFNLNTPEKRDAWMTSRAKATNWDEKIFGELLIRFGTIENLKEAKEKEETLNKQKMLEIAEKMPVEMKAETLHEMAPSGMFCSVPSFDRASYDEILSILYYLHSFYHVVVRNASYFSLRIISIRNACHPPYVSLPRRRPQWQEAD
jgi:hypothetical protein